jgi:CRP-like cAMP-binding protein
MLVGARLFATDSPVDTVARVMGLDVPPPSSLRASVPPALDEICRRALTRSVEDRTATAAVLADQLDACIAGDDGPGALTATLTNYGLESRRGASATRVRGPGAASSSQTSTAQKATDELSRPLPGIADSEVRRLEAVMKKNPSLVVLTDLGERYVELGMANEARSAIRTAAFHFSQRGLLVQAVCALHSLRPLVDDAAFVDDLFRLARLRGASTAQLAEAMQHVEHRVFAEAIAAADVARVVDDGLDATFVPPKAPLLARLPEPDFVKLAGLARVERRQSGVPVVVEGERGDALYAVGRGCVVVHTRRHVVEDVGGGSAAPTGTAPTDPRAYLAALGEGDFFGELSFLTRSARTATVEAISPVVLLRIDRDVVENLATAEAAFRVHLLDFYKERVAELVLAKNPILGALPTEARRGIVAVADIRKYRRGDEIVREGDETDELFVVLAGEVEVTRQVQGFPMFINKLNTGDLFGEMALLGGSRRTATVRAMGVVEVLGVRRADVDQILAGDARVRGLLENAMRIRAAETDARVRDTVRIFEGV